MSDGEYYESVTGRFDAQEQKQLHHLGWNNALDDAITRFEQENPDARGEFTADVKLSITFYRKSPGWVGEYKIGLDRITQTGS
jgi:hypothetical protein